MLKHAEPERRVLALKTMGFSRETIEHWQEIIEIQVRMVDDPDESVRDYSLGCLALCRQTKKNVKTALPKLMAHLQDEDALCRVEAARAVWKFTKQSQEVLPVLRKELHNPEANIRIRAIEGLRSLGKDCLPAWEELVELAWKDDVLEVRRLAIGTLNRGSQKAVPILLSLLNDQENAVQTSAVYAISALSPEAVGRAISFEPCSGSAIR